MISKAYSGTGALKTDYTRTGKRTNEGLLQDGINSIMRYVKNNFLDGPRQDAYDLVTGTWQPRKGDSQPFVDHRPLLTRIVRICFMILLSLAQLRHHRCRTFLHLRYRCFYSISARHPSLAVSALPFMACVFANTGHSLHSRSTNLRCVQLPPLVGLVLLSSTAWHRLRRMASPPAVDRHDQLLRQGLFLRQTWKRVCCWRGRQDWWQAQAAGSQRDRR